MTDADKPKQKGGISNAVFRFRPLRATKHRVMQAVRSIRVPKLQGGLKPSMILFYLFADRSRYPNSEAAVARLRAEFSRWSATLVTIDNFAEPGLEHEISANTWQISGDNSYWEFSGWQRAIAWSLKLGDDFEHALFINDAFLNDPGHDETFFRSVFNPISLTAAGEGCYGRVWKQDGPALFRGRDVGTWIQSNAFSMPYRIARTLNLKSMSPEDIDVCFPTQFCESLFCKGCPLNNEFKEYLDDWIHRGWPRRKPFTAENWPFLRSKLTAILNERLLSSQMARAGIPLFTFGRGELLKGATMPFALRWPSSMIS